MSNAISEFPNLKVLCFCINFRILRPRFASSRAPWLARLFTQWHRRVVRKAPEAPELPASAHQVTHRRVSVPAVRGRRFRRGTRNEIPSRYAAPFSLNETEPQRGIVVNSQYPSFPAVNPNFQPGVVGGVVFIRWSGTEPRLQ
jgi:hypothetical protein